MEVNSLYGAKNLKTLHVPNGIEVRYSAFKDCNKLKSVYIYNEDCELDTSSMDRTFPKGVTIYGKKDSTAEKYARKFRLKFKTINME